MESAKRSWVRSILQSTRLGRENKIKRLLNVSTWNEKNRGANINEALGNLINRNNEAIVQATRNMLLNNAMILVNPIGHEPPANKYKGFLQRYGKFLSHNYKKTILTKAPYKKSTAANYNKRHPKKLERVLTARISPHEALAKHFFPKGPKPVEYLGGGVDGKVYIANDGRLIKFVNGSVPQEYTALRNLQGTGLVPSFRNGNGKVLPLTQFHQVMAKKLFGGNASSHMTAFIMGRVGGTKSMTLRKYVRTHPSVNRENIERRMRTAINTLGLKGISHGNMHDENIIVEVDSNGRIRRMWLIDFGRSNKLNINQTARSMLAAAQGILQRRGEKVRTYPTRGLYGTTIDVPLAGVGQNRRIDPHMFLALTGKEYTRANESQIANYRKLIAGMKNRRVTTPTRRAKSASPNRPRPRRTSST